MDIDLFMALLNPSMMVVLGSTFFVLWLYQRRRRLLLLFSGGYACLAAGFLLQFFMLPGGFDFTKFVSATCFTLGVCTMAGGIVALYGRRPPYVALAVLAGGGMAALCWFLFVEPDVVWRIYSLNFAFGGVCLVLVNELRRVRGAPTARIFRALGLAQVLNFFVRTLASIRIFGSPGGNEAFGHSFYWMTAVLSHALLGLLLALTLMVTVALEMLASLRTDSRTDPLSGLLNRRGFEEEAARVLAQSAKADLPVALVLSDLDHFKVVNDRYGHAAGDRVIADFAGRLQSAAAGQGVAGRIGGEEFAVLLPLADLAAARLFAEAVRTVFSSGTVDGLPAEARATASFGIAARSGREDLAAFMCRADEALYKAKQNGRDSVRISYQRPRTALAPENAGMG